MNMKSITIMQKMSKEYKLTYLINSDAHRPELIYTEKMRELEETVAFLGIKVTKLLPKERHRTSV